jgi:hypothetical protein
MKKEKLIKFIEDNKLNLDEDASAANSVCTVICGFSLFVGYTDYKDLMGDIEDSGIDYSTGFFNEVQKVFDYAKRAAYGTAWESQNYKNQYIY